jgi:hypothetical protein
MAVLRIFGKGGAVDNSGTRNGGASRRKHRIAVGMHAAAALERDPAGARVVAYT